jgi:hypothetical protein
VPLTIVSFGSSGWRTTIGLPSHTTVGAELEDAFPQPARNATATSAALLTVAGAAAS